MENAFSWDIEIQFVPHRRHITSQLQSPDFLVADPEVPGSILGATRFSE
jgi:hypothetical protein